MRYLLLIYFDPAIYTNMAPAESQATMDAYWTFDDDVKAAGVWVSGNALHDHDQTSLLRMRDGERIVSDGPFIETKEVLGGYYLIDVPGIEEARYWASRIPDATRGTIEIRPIVEFERPA